MKLKKFLSVGLAAVSAFALSASAMAYEAPSNVTISVPSSDSHQYDAYQIFVGNVDDSGKLNNVKWGKNGVGEEGTAVSPETLATLTAAMKDDSGSADVVKNDRDELTTIESFVNLASTPVNTGSIDKDHPATVLSGYYLIKDRSTTLSGEDTFSQYIVQIANDIQISRKATSTTPTLDKKVDGVQGKDAKVGDELTYTITVTMPDNISAYKKFNFVVEDTLSTGLTFKGTPYVTFSADGTNEAVYPAATVKVEGQKMTVESNDVVLNTLDEVNSASKFIVYYKATVNSNAVNVNNNEAKLSYSNNPNSDSTGTLNEGPNDVVPVYTYKLVITEVTADGSKTPISDLGLKLMYKPAGSDSYTEIATLSTDTNGVVNFAGLDAGDYKLVETTVPSGFSKHDDIAFSITSDIDSEGVLKGLTTDIGENAIVIESSADYQTGIVTATIANNATASLPVTGTIGIVVLGAAALAACGGAIGMRMKSKKEDGEEA